jgi:hypothetical protein
VEACIHTIPSTFSTLVLARHSFVELGGFAAAESWQFPEIILARMPLEYWQFLYGNLAKKFF